MECEDMGVTITSKGTGFLQTVGVPQALIDEMQKHGIKLTLGFNDFSFVSAKNDILSKGILPTTSNLLVKGATSAQKNAAAFALGEAIHKAIKELSPAAPAFAQSGTAKADTGPDGTPLEPKMKKKNWNLDPEKEMTKIIPPETVMKAPTATGKEGVVSLVNATKMYQRVHGTSKGSVYVTVAMTSNGDLKLAAKIKGSGISVRAEGTLPEKIKQALQKQGITPKGDYASGHFDCGHVSVSRVMGAILLGLGIEFATPLPNMEKVKELSA